MSRPLRIEYGNAIYHVMCRGRGRQTIFPDAEYYESFIAGLKEAHQRFSLQVLAYCLMGNHYHLLLKTPLANLSRCMRHINGLYTQRYNRLKKTDGPLFRGRYKAILIDADRYLLQVSRYIHRNPIDTRTPLVKHLKDYRWSSYVYFVKSSRPPEWLDRDYVLDALNSPHRYQAYHRYVEAGLDEETENFYDKKALPGIWGSKAFIQEAYEKVDTECLEISHRAMVERPSIDTVIACVAENYQCKESALRHTARGQGRKNIPRWVAMYLSQVVCGESLPRIAEVFNVGHYSTVSQTIRRLKSAMEKDTKLTRQVNMLSQDLTL